MPYRRFNRGWIEVRQSGGICRMGVLSRSNAGAMIRRLVGVGVRVRKATQSCRLPEQSIDDKDGNEKVRNYEAKCTL